MINRTQLMQDIITASNYCTTSQLEAILNLMNCFKDTNEERKNGKRKKAPIRSVENTSKEDN